MRPALKPGLLAVWRDRDTLQIGIDPRRAIALRGMGQARGLLRLVDGSRDRAQVLAAARELGIPETAADRVLTLLAAAGALQDFPAGVHRVVPVPVRRRLAPELATAALAYGDCDGGARTLARRQAAWIRVHGASSAGLSLAGLLTAAGIGRVTTSGQIRPALPAAGGRDENRPGAGADDNAVAGLGSAAGHGDLPRGLATGGSPAPPRPDLVILAAPCHPELPAALVSGRIPHLAISAAEAIGTVGPLVLPGRSACLRCLDLTRADRDPAWPLILAQVAGREPEPPACDATLAAAVAAQAAAQVLYCVDRACPAAAVTNGTLELVLPGWQWRRRSWLPHSRCGCGSQAGS
ncbi:MAG: thiamine biosynthesis protein ThiF [Actinobacteria bacterium]|nr:thiamine biosynthesis protein ThiF [Actinomycetota bacterium]